MNDKLNICIEMKHCASEDVLRVKKWENEVVVRGYKMEW